MRGGLPNTELRSSTAGERGARITFAWNGREVIAYEGESIAAALLAAGERGFRLTDRGRAPRAYFCGMGVCHDCLVTADGEANVRSCTTPARAGMSVESQAPLEIGDER